jgi:hypothetical protein
MTAAEWIAVAIFAMGVIYAAGQIVKGKESEVKQLKLDLNGLGKKTRQDQLRKYNISLLIVAMADSREERFRLVELFKED